MALTCLATVAVWPGGPALCAAQGGLGASSQGSISITLTVAPRVRLAIEGDAPVQAAAYDGSVALARGACLWSNTATRGLRLVATGGAVQGAPRLIPLGALESAGPDCARRGGTGARLVMVLPPARLQRAALSAAATEPPGLLVVPE